MNPKTNQIWSNATEIIKIDDVVDSIFDFGGWVHYTHLSPPEKYNHKLTTRLNDFIKWFKYDENLTAINDIIT